MTKSRPGSRDSFPVKSVYYAAVLLPYAAVSAGLYLLHSAWAAMLGYQAGILLFLLIIRPPHFESNPGREGPPRKLVAALLSACLLSGPLAVLLWPIAERLPAGGLAAWLTGLGVTARAWPAFVAYMCLTTPWLEERYWRSWLGRSGRPVFETPAWFAGYHLLVLMPILGPAWLGLVFASLASAGWGWQRLMRFRDGFHWAVFCHSVADLSVMLAASWLLSN